MRLNELLLKDWLEVEEILREEDPMRSIDLVTFFYGSVEEMDYGEFSSKLNELSFLNESGTAEEPTTIVVNGVEYKPVKKREDITVGVYTNYMTVLKMDSVEQLVNVLYGPVFDSILLVDYLNAKERMEQLITELHNAYKNLFTPTTEEPDPYSQKGQGTPWISEVSKEWGVSWFEVLDKPIVMFFNTVCFLMDKSKKQEAMTNINKRVY